MHFLTSNRSSESIDEASTSVKVDWRGLFGFRSEVPAATEPRLRKKDMTLNVCASAVQQFPRSLLIDYEAIIYRKEKYVSDFHCCTLRLPGHAETPRARPAT